MSGIAKDALRTLGLDPQDTYLILSGILKVNIGLPAHVVQGLLSNPNRIELDIAELDYQRLAYERETALGQGIWVPSDEDYVPVTIRYEGQTLHGKVRLKGDWPDHWYSEKWSLRFKLDNDDRLDHMREFAIQTPRTRFYMAEWVFQQALAREHLSGLSYGFVDITINGKSMGTYAIEEAFDDGITLYNKQTPGPLIRFSDTELFKSREADNPIPDAFQTGVLDAFGGKALEAGYSENETAAALRLLEQWRSGEIPAHDAFDLNRTARYFALSDLLGNIHGNIFHNMRFYYNPVSARLEPVGHDSNSGMAIGTIASNSIDPYTYSYLRLFFDDPEFTDRYLAELERVSAEGYLENMFAELEPGFDTNVSIIYRDQPFYYFRRQTYFDNRETIRAALHPYRAVRAYVNGTATVDPVVDLGASQPLPVEVTAVLADGVRAVPEGGPVRLPGKKPDEPMQFQTVAFTIPAGVVWNTSAPMEVESRVIGTSEVRLESIQLTPRLQGDAETGALMRQSDNSASLPFAVTDTVHRIVYLLPGSHRLDHSLITPEGYTLRCGPNTSLDLVQNASIVAHGPLEWVGTEESPITVRSSDGTGRGVIVLRAGNPSILDNVRLGPLTSSGANKEPWPAMTFLESPATLTSVSVQGDRTAPLLRLVDSPFNITGAAFIGGSTPSISAEYSSGAFTETLIAEGGGLRAIGSIVRLERSRFERIPEIAVQVGHESTLSGAEVAVRAAGTAFACESGSTITGDGISVRDTGVGVQTDRVGAGFEAGTVTLNHPNFSNVTTPYVQDGGGTIVVDSRRVNP